MVWIKQILQNFFFWLCWLSVAWTSTSHYKGCQIYEISGTESNFQHFAYAMQNSNLSEYFDVFSVLRNPKPFMSVMVYPNGLEEMKYLIQKFALTYNITDRNVERSILNEKIKNIDTKRRGKRSTDTFQHNSYLSINEMQMFLKEVSNLFPFASIEEIGKSYENRSILLAKISKNRTLPIIWIDAGIHAREWIAPATALYIITTLLTDLEHKFLDKYQFYIAPNINPDGYEFSFTSNRFWRKNRVRISNSRCIGVDLNRNFPYKWGMKGTSVLHCSETFGGAFGGDQVETKAVIDKLETIKHQTKLYLTLHSYGQYLLTPFGYDNGVYPPKYAKLMDMAATITHKILEKHGLVYQFGSAADILYAASGGSDDYASGKLKIPYSYTIELPDRGGHNFLLPPAYINFVGEQIWTALEVLVNQMD